MERLAGSRWRKSSYSGSNGGGCVEVCEKASHVLVRDTQNRRGPVLRFSAGSWHKFTGQIKKADNRDSI